MKPEVRVGLITAGCAAALGALVLAASTPAIAARMSARLSFGAFLVAFALGPWSRPSRGVLGALERRAWAAFVAAHFVHLAYLANNVLRLADRPPLWRAGGGMAAYAVIGVVGLALLATREGARTPKLRWLIDVGGLYVTTVFVTSYAGRAGSVTSGYAALLVLAIAAPIAHWAGVLTRRASAA